MQIKRKDLEKLVKGLQRADIALKDFGAAINYQDVYSAYRLGLDLLEAPLPDPVDVVPVQDYPFPLTNHMKGHPT